MYLDPENKTFTFDYSTSSITCDRKLYFSRLLSLRKKLQSEALHAGKAVHKFVEHFWLGNDFKSCAEQFLSIAVEESSPLDPALDSNNKRGVRRLLEILGSYYKKYDPQRLSWKPLIIGDKPAVEIGFAFILGVVEGWTLIYCGRIDRVMVMDGEPTIVDTKTTTRFGATYWEMLRPNHQITGYCAGMSELAGLAVKRAAIDVIYIGDERTADENGNYRIPKAVKAAGPDAIADWMLNVKFEHGPTNRSKEDIEEWWVDMLVEGTRMRKLFENPSHESWSRKTSQCTAFGACEFKDICSLRGLNQQIMEQLYEVHVWTPYD